MSFIVGKPFKGRWYYEMQIGAYVLQVRHDDEHAPRDSSPRKLIKIGRFQVWYDSCWRSHMLLFPGRGRYLRWRAKRRLRRL